MRKKYDKIIFIAPLKPLKKGVDPELDPDPLFRGSENHVNLCLVPMIREFFRIGQLYLKLAGTTAP